MKTEDLYAKKELCCGCGMCADMCPAGVIHMKEDIDGFFYPEITDTLSCLNCKKCLKICPLKDVAHDVSKNIGFYAGSYKADKETISCASGGLATAISTKFLENNGIVYGVAYSDDWHTVEYARIDSCEDINKLKTSKYAQSKKGHIYRCLHDDLRNNKKCLFIGLPCDVAAVKKAFHNNDNLYTMELICHGPTSPSVQKQYCTKMEEKFDSVIDYFSVRYKKNGKWTPFYIKVKMKNGKEFMEQFHLSSYGAAFRYLKRPSCRVCPIKGSALRGDLMIGDYHYVEKGMKGYNPHGVSSAIVHTLKGKELINSLDNTFSLTPIEEKNALENGAIHKPIPAPAGWEKYQKVFRKDGLFKAYRLPFVIRSNMQRKMKARCLRLAVRIKRILIPGSRIKE